MEENSSDTCHPVPAEHVNKRVSYAWGQFPTSILSSPEDGRAKEVSADGGI